MRCGSWHIRCHDAIGTCANVDAIGTCANVDAIGPIASAGRGDGDTPEKAVADGLGKCYNVGHGEANDHRPGTSQAAARGEKRLGGVFPDELHRRQDAAHQAAHRRRYGRRALHAPAALRQDDCAPDAEGVFREGAERHVVSL